MADTLTTRGGEIDAEVNNLYSRQLLTRAQPALLHNRFAQVRDIPMHSGTDIIKFRKYGDLTANTTALTEGVTPTGKQLSITDITATVLRYGDYVTFTDKVLTETMDPILMETAEILGDQMGDTLDQLCRDILVAGTTIQYASIATAVNEVSAAMKLTRAEIKEAVRTLRGNNAKPMTEMVDPTNAYNTIPIGRSFVGIISEDTLYDLDDADGWIPVENYPSKATVMPDEVGSLANVRFIMSTNAKVKSAEGVDSNDVHVTVILAKEAYGQSRISGEAVKNIIKPLGSAGSADPLDQRQTSGWKATYVAKILQQGFLVVINHGVSA